MDPFTHSLLGGLSAKTVQAPRRRFWIMVLLGLAPDLDVVFNSFGNMSLVWGHHGITHSIFGAVVQILLYAAIMTRWDPGPYRTRALHYSLPISLHLFGDYITFYGIPLLAPFTFRNYSGDIIGAIVIVPMLITVLGLFFLIRKKQEGWTATRPLWVFWGIYLIFAISCKLEVVRLLQIPAANVTAVPSLADPLGWRAIEVDKEGNVYREHKINLLKRTTKEEKVFRMIPFDDPIVKIGLTSQKVQNTLKWDRWPVMRIKKTEEGWQTDWGYIVFSTLGKIRSKVLVNISQDGTITREQYVVDFWDPDKI